MLSIKKIWKAVSICICVVAIIGTTGCFPTEEDMYYSDEFNGSAKITNGEVVVTGILEYTYEDIESVGYRVFREDGNGNIDLKNDTPVAAGNAAAEDGEFNSVDEYCNLKFAVPVSGRYQIIFDINGNLRSKINKKIIIANDGGVVDDIVNTYINNSSIRVESNILKEYSYVLYKIDGDARNIIKTGTISIQNYEYYADVAVDKAGGNGIYELRVYKESLEEINGKFENFICINSEINSYKFIFE